MKNTDIKISVMMVTYNHGKYIEQAIQSVLAQKVDFKYELLIGEDCSTDKTREIAEKYQAMYPDIINVIAHNKNVGALKNEADLRQRCRGEYIAVLEGDDYWIYEDKLKRQATFLDAHPQYIGIAHNVKVIGESGEKVPFELEGFHHEKAHVYTKKNALDFEMVGHLSGWMYRNIWRTLSQRELYLIRKCNVNSDLKLSIVLGLKGDIYYLEDEWSVYRRRFTGDGWSAQFYKKNLIPFKYNESVEIKNLLWECYGEKTDIEQRLLEYIYMGFTNWKRNPSIENGKILLELIRKREIKKKDMIQYIIDNMICS